jgi:hypothetical protein
MTNEPEKDNLFLSALDDGTLKVVRLMHRYRFMFSDGSTLDVLCDRDDSDVRGAVLKHAAKERIEGVAVVPAQEVLL